MLRTNDFIDEYIKALADLWKQFPELRLTQLLHNAVKLSYPNQDCTFYFSDEKILKCLLDMPQKLEELDKLYSEE